MRSIPDCVGSGLLDLDSGDLLGARCSEDCPPEALETVVAATAGLLRSGAAPAIETRFAAPREIGDLGRDTQEFVVFSGGMLHVFVRSRSNPSHLLCFACRRNANVGMVLSKSRAALEPVTSAI